ncbi:uncharacterized protein LOC141606519 [Silene latifolia]|uniref:uncharacterized protein LOC141606519 n=1 Tax=Silene latifolia TaxID=37657 RepID=UPI003D77A62A
MESYLHDAATEVDKGKPLHDAATRGDIEFVRRLYNDNREDPSLCFLIYNDSDRCNFLHAAIESGHYTFLFEALNILSSYPTLVIKLICQETRNGNTLHVAAEYGNIFILQLLVNAYTKAISAAKSNQETLAWLATIYFGSTPLHFTSPNIMPTSENIARYLVSLDEHFLKTMGQSYPMNQCSTLRLEHGKSIVFIGMQRGFSQLVKQILISDLPYSLRGAHGKTPLHYASKCNEQVSRILLEKHPGLIRVVCSFGMTMLDHAVEDGTTWLIRLMLTQVDNTKPTIPYPARLPWTKACETTRTRTKKGDTPFHIAARRGDIEILEILIQGYKSALEEETKYCDGADAVSEPGNDLIGDSLFHIENFEKEIPLIIALRKKYDDCGLILSEETFPSTMGSALRFNYKRSLPIAIENGCLLSAKKIIERVISCSRMSRLEFRLNQLEIHNPIILNIARHIAKKSPGMHEMVEAEEFKKFLELIPRFLGENKKDSKTILKEAVEKGEDWFIRLALDSDRDLFKECVPAWQVACEKGNISFLLVFIELCGHEKFIEHCQDKGQTPLHHIKLMRFEEYVELLKMPVLKELTNQLDSDRATPLHRAILRCDLELTKALLETDGIDINIEDNNCTTALDLLEKNCKLSTSWLEQYIKLLKIPVFEKFLNQRKMDGTSPLHRAIQRDDLELTKALLEIKGIDVSIKDKNGRTALDLLQKSCGLSPSWGKMCREIKEDSTVKKLKYLFRKISFEGMQNTLSVVAALVATITFAAGFTVPGGPDSKDGTPMLATNAAFLAFSVSNTLAMCCSIMVLFLLLGPMMWDPHPSLFYVNLSLSLLLMSLSGTMVAFMTGVYATMAPKTKWNAIFVLVSCSLALSMACIVLLLTYSPRFKKLFTWNTYKEAVQAPYVATASILHQPPGSPNRSLSQASNNIELTVIVQSESLTLQACDDKAGSSNTIMTYDDKPDSEQFERSNTILTFDGEFMTFDDELDSEQLGRSNTVMTYVGKPDSEQFERSNTVMTFDGEFMTFDGERDSEQFGRSNTVMTYVGNAYSEQFGRSNTIMTYDGKPDTEQFERSNTVMTFDGEQDSEKFGRSNTGMTYVGNAYSEQFGRSNTMMTYDGKPDSEQFGRSNTVMTNDGKPDSEQFGRSNTVVTYDGKPDSEQFGRSNTVMTNDGKPDSEQFGRSNTVVTYDGKPDSEQFGRSNTVMTNDGKPDSEQGKPDSEQFGRSNTAMTNDGNRIVSNLEDQTRS